MFASSPAASALTRAGRRLPLAIALSCIAVAAHAVPWTTIGSAGVPDDADVGDYEFTSGIAQIPAAAPAGTVAYLRYNLPALAGFKGTKNTLWRVRFRDTGADASVNLSLRQYKTDGTTTTVGLFDSDSFAGNSLPQTAEVCIPNAVWNFNDGPFYVEAQLIKSAVTGGASLNSMVLIPGGCNP